MHYPSIESTTPANQSPRARLLIVEGNQRVRALLALVFTLEGYAVETAKDGGAALERLAVGQFDLVLTDRHTPKLDGASMVLALRSAGSRIPVIMVSGSLAHAPLPPNVAREISAVLPKSSRTAEVLSAVARALELASETI
jgi:CheY-like chemotaxis protein